MHHIKNWLIDFSIRRHRLVACLVLVLTMAAGSFFPGMTLDTDPENMLEPTEPVRLFHNHSKQRFDLSDTIVLGVINERDPDGVFNPE
ncbi:hypothetical protein [Desulfobulbus propionicus]